MHSLSELESSFLVLETERSPLHTGGVYLFKRPPRSGLSFNRFRDILESKLGNEAFFRKRLVEHKLNLELPLWVDDPDFELENHLHYITLNKLEQKQTLMEFASGFFSTPLDKTRPLWQAIYMDGLGEDHGKSSFALLLKVHITALDGTSGEDILSQLLHVSPELEELPELEPWEPEPMPNTNKWLGVAINNAIHIPGKLTSLAKDTAASAFYATVYERLKKMNLPSALMRVANTPINQSITRNRKIEHTIIALAQIRSIRNHLPHVTTNDILMGICAEALCHFISVHGENKPKVPLIALGPISVRSTSLNYKSGNQLAATLFSLATTEDDPVKRIQMIHEAATASNSYKSAISANRLSELVPSCIAGLSARAYSEFLLAQKYKPMFNLPITNIPGPQFPLYLEDAELQSFICASPLFDGIGLALMIISYNGHYHISSTYCPDILETSVSFNFYLNAAVERIHDQLENRNYPQEQTHQNTAETGLIEDIVGLFSDIFSFTAPKSGSQTQPDKVK